VLAEFLVGHGLGGSDAAVPFAEGLRVLDLVLRDFDKYWHNLKLKVKSEK